MIKTNFTETEAKWLVPFLKEGVLFFDNPQRRRHKYFSATRLALEKLKQHSGTTLYTRIEKLMIVSSVNHQRDILYAQLQTSEKGTPERQAAENAVDMRKDVLEKCGYYRRNPRFCYENNTRFNLNDYESRRYEQSGRK
ncbi:MAG: hypothetical protein EPO58_16055 [Chitinophagaceae bacterium]|nr:MAG: hypothetical protein EPO58_16055 [Chitinophagaceae bacterium]